MDDDGIDWEELLASEGMPSELRMLTQSQSGEGHNDGLVCVSTTLSARSENKTETATVASQQHAKEWYLKANFRAHGVVTSMSETDVANFWREFSSRIWESGIAGERLNFLLDYAEHGFLSRSCAKFGYDRYFGKKLIDFVLRSPRKDESCLD